MMTDVSKFEDAVEIMMDKGETKNCLDYIETEIDEDIVLNSCYLFDTKLNCLYELDRKLDAFREAKAYRADYLPLTPIVCTVLGNEYEKECNYTESYFYFSQFKFPDQDVTLSRLVKEMENEVKKKLDEEKYEEVVDYVNTINHDVVFSSEDLFDSKLKCLNLLNRKKELLKEAKAHLKAGGILSYYTSGILGSSYAELGNYGEARQHYIKAIQTCKTQEEKLGYRNLLKLMEKEEETRKIRKENKRVEKIDPSFLKGENKNFEQTKKKINPHKSIKEKDGSQLQCGVKNSQGDLNTEKEAKAIIAEKMIFMWCI
ncbi:uncharacterized protein LOC104903316 isoform X1 [Beta vulgaris subsp. vulgaris]|nr:uncharacterized protein LOC104903316 isoform X1 [Beta vulgaris subsp. vulgaris]